MDTLPLPTGPLPTGVIVADDDPLIRSVLKSKLSTLGQEVYQAINGVEAVALASRMQACLIILDVRMPKMNGLKACAEIRKLPGYARTPIVMLTFAGGKDTQSLASRAGATEFLIKPFATAALMLALSRFLPIDGATQQAIQGDAVRAAAGQTFVRPRG